LYDTTKLFNMMFWRKRHFLIGFLSIQFAFNLGVVAGFAATLTITGEQLNVYRGPGRTYAVLDVVKCNEQFEILAEEAEWYQISVDGRLGWVAAKGVSRTGSTTTAELLAQADRYFARQQFTTPPEANAFDLYQQVLQSEPDNAHARKKIAQMAAYYKLWAERTEQQGDTAKAQIFYQRYLFLQPHDGSLPEAAVPDVSGNLSNGLLPVIRLRAEPRSVSPEEIQRMIRKYHFHHPADWSKYGLVPSITGNFRHDFVPETGTTVTVMIDYATELMWSTTGSPAPLTWDAAQAYIAQLNVDGYAGYRDWRLPTVEEGASLLRATKNQHNRYCELDLETLPLWCWSSDPVATAADTAWYISFTSGGIQPHAKLNTAFVLAVRTNIRPK
jgi:hypothetical protein